jgi:hypothetical protein
MSEIKFQLVSDEDLFKASLFNRAKLLKTGCWEWTGAKVTSGYGHLRVPNEKGPRKTMLAHRAYYEAFVGEIPNGLLLRHTCDNRLCVNPNHLAPGTHLENMADYRARGVSGPKRASRNGNSKLTEADVAEIRSSDLSVTELAEAYGTDRTNIWCVKSGKTWKHLNAAISLEETI